MRRVYRLEIPGERNAYTKARNCHDAVESFLDRGYDVDLGTVSVERTNINGRFWLALWKPVPA